MVVGPANEFVRERGRKFLNCTHLESTSRKKTEGRFVVDRLKRRLHFMASDRLPEIIDTF